MKSLYGFDQNYSDKIAYKPNNLSRKILNHSTSNDIIKNMLH
jgi:hypothetical protein